MCCMDFRLLIFNLPNYANKKINRRPLPESSTDSNHQSVFGCGRNPRSSAASHSHPAFHSAFSILTTLKDANPRLSGVSHQRISFAEELRSISGLEQRLAHVWAIVKRPLRGLRAALGNCFLRLKTKS